VNNTLKVGVHDFRLYARLGVYEEERILKNLLSIDIEVVAGRNTKPYKGIKTINYLSLIEIIKECCAEETHLMEELAQAVIKKTTKKFNGVKSIHLRIRKLRPVMGFNAGDVFVEMEYLNN
jgi:dihydroneopterin aldolase